MELCVREATADDAHFLDYGFAQLSSRSRYYRFFSSMPRLPETLRNHLNDVDGLRHAAVIAFDCTSLAENESTEIGQHPVGVARWIADSAGNHHLSVAVIDDYQGSGVGSALLDSLIELAASRGIVKLRADVLNDNLAMRALLRRRGAITVAGDDPSIVVFELPIPPSRIPPSPSPSPGT